MSEKAAQLWRRATEIDASPDELWDDLVKTNQQLDWDRNSLRERANDDCARQQVGVSADD